jgi:nucleotidyltransferase substrate binding protein (TIGR01987 family)
MHMTQDIRWKQRFENFQRAFKQLSLAMDLKAQRPLSDLEQQGLIQGFEFTHELAWNVLKDYLEMEGIQGLIGSRSTAREAFKRGLVTDGEVWMDMIEKRNLSIQSFNQNVANTLVSSISDHYYPAFCKLHQRFTTAAHTIHDLIDHPGLREHIERVGQPFYKAQKAQTTGNRLQ